MRPFARHRRSGATSSCSQANIVPGAAEAGRDLVADQQHVVARRTARAPRAGSPAGCTSIPAAPWTSGSMITAAIALAVLAEQRARRSAASPGSACSDVEQQRAVELVEEVDAADRDRADRVAVVGLAQADELGAPRLAAALLPVLEGHLERDLDGGRAVVGVEDAAQPGRARSHQPRGELDRPPGARGRASSSARRGRAASRIAASMRGWRWPWTLHQSDETPSRYAVPSVS